MPRKPAIRDKMKLDAYTHVLGVHKQRSGFCLTISGRACVAHLSLLVLQAWAVPDTGVSTQCAASLRETASRGVR
jgi:hypothetical protein